MTEAIGFDGFSAGDFLLGEDEIDLGELLAASGLVSPMPLALNSVVAAVEPGLSSPDVQLIFDDGIDTTINILGL